MKKPIVITLLFLLLSFCSYGQEGIVTKINNDKTVEINIGKSAGLKKGDKFSLYGKGQYVHPATGNVTESENIHLADIEVIEISQNTSKAKIINTFYEISVNSRVLNFSIENEPKKTVIEPQQSSTVTNTSQQNNTKNFFDNKQRIKREKKVKEVFDNRFYAHVGYYIEKAKFKYYGYDYVSGTYRTISSDFSDPVLQYGLNYLQYINLLKFKDERMKVGLDYSLNVVHCFDNIIIPYQLSIGPSPTFSFNYNNKVVFSANAGLHLWFYTEEFAEPALLKKIGVSFRIKRFISGINFGWISPYDEKIKQSGFYIGYSF